MRSCTVGKEKINVVSLLSHQLLISQVPTFLAKLPMQSSTNKLMLEDAHTVQEEEGGSQDGHPDRNKVSSHVPMIFY